MIRQTVLLRRILSYFVTPSQLGEYDTLVIKNKGSASHFAFRLIERYFDHKDRKENPERYREDFVKTNSDSVKTNRIKVNSSNGSYYL